MLSILLIMTSLSKNNILDTILTHTNLVDQSELQEGDHIFRYGAIFKNSLLTHHGIYLGNNQVISFIFNL